MRKFSPDDGLSRRKVLECMTWVGTGVLWTVSGGVPHSLGLIGSAAAQPARSLAPYSLRWKLKKQSDR